MSLVIVLAMSPQGIGRCHDPFWGNGVLPDLIGGAMDILSAVESLVGNYDIIERDEFADQSSER
jgi:hypothetical protein